MPLVSHHIRAPHQPPPWPADTGRVVVTVAGSTSAEATGYCGRTARPTWICALEQTDAKGRRGRVWHSPPGNFAASLVYTPRVAGPATARPNRRVTGSHMALRGFVAALAIYDAVAHLCGSTRALALKWPNDVLLGGGKLAGVLLETGPHGSLIIGIGVNLVCAPAQGQLEDGALPPTSLLAQTGIRVTPCAFLDHLAPAFAAFEECLVRDGFAPIRELWLSRAAGLGQPVTARMMAQTHRGIFHGIDPEGHLILAAADGIHQTIAAGDVFFH